MITQLATPIDTQESRLCHSAASFPFNICSICDSIQRHCQYISNRTAYNFPFYIVQTINYETIPTITTVDVAAMLTLPIISISTTTHIRYDSHCRGINILITTQIQIFVRKFTKHSLKQWSLNNHSHMELPRCDIQSARDWNYIRAHFHACF